MQLSDLNLEQAYRNKKIMNYNAPSQDIKRILKNKKKNRVEKLTEIFQLERFSSVKGNEDFQIRLADSKKFFLDVKKTQSFYDNANPETIIWSETFVPPFNNCLFIFDEALVIKWTNGVDQAKYADTKLLGILLTEKAEVTKTGVAYNEKDGEKVDITNKNYKAYLLFEEELEDAVIFSNQFIHIGALTFKKGAESYTRLDSIDHYPCQSPSLCALNKEGTLKDWARDIPKPFFCQEVLTRDSLLETLYRLINKIHEVTVVEKKKTRKNDIPNVPKIPMVMNLTKGDFPKENYVQYLEGKRYKYNPKEIEHGTGIAHRYRYDVRRHPRIVKGKLIWINSHQRGSGSYIPKIYANRKTWFVNYIWYQAEKLTKYRIFELIAIKLINFFKKKRK